MSMKINYTAIKLVLAKQWKLNKRQEMTMQGLKKMSVLKDTKSIRKFLNSPK